MPVTTEMNTRSTRSSRTGGSHARARSASFHRSRRESGDDMALEEHDQHGTGQHRHERDAASSPQSVPVTPTYSASAVGIVRASTLVSRDAKRNSFHAKIHVNINVTARPGRRIGRSTDQGARRRARPVDERRLVELLRDRVDHALQHPHGERHVQKHGVEQDQAELRVETARVAVGEHL